MHAFLSDSVREALLQLVTLAPSSQLKITQKQFTVTLHRLLHTSQEYDQLISCLFACLTRISECVAIRTVRFDAEILGILDNSDILWNPDATRLTIPLFGLKRIEIYAAAHHPSAVEYFLTHCLNELGPKHLNQFVEAVVIGDISDLHPNIRNNLQNLCHHVTTSPTRHYPVREPQELTF